MNNFLFNASSSKSQNLDLNFESNCEWFPWWQINLHNITSINGIEIENWHLEEHQLPLISILASLDGNAWVPIWTQAFHEIKIKNNITIHFPKIIDTKFIRIRYDGYGILKFTNIKPIISNINGQLISDIYEYTLAKSKKINVVFSTLYNESDEYLPLYINNFISYTPKNAFLIINFPPDRIIPQYLKNINPRVHIFNGNVERQKWGNTILLGHIETFEISKKIFPNFTHFVSMASNALMVNKLNITQILLQLSLNTRIPIASERAYERDLDIDVLNPTYHGTWMWHHFRSVKGLGEYIVNKGQLDKLSATQIEGLFASRKDWELINERRSLIEGLTPYISNDYFMAFEECIPISIFNKFGSGKYTYICHMLWRQARQATINDLLYMVPNLPQHLCALKWFDRSTTNQATLIVTSDWGRQLLSLATSPCDINHFVTANSLKSFLEVIKSKESYGPLSNHWWNNEDFGKIGLHFDLKDTLCVRDILNIPIPNINEFDNNPLYLFLEGTNHILTLSLTIYEKENGNTLLKYTCSAKDENLTPISGSHLEAYLYLSPMIKNTIFCLTSSKKNIDQEHNLSRIVLYDEFSYAIYSPEREEITKNIEKKYFVHHNKSHDKFVWIGIPIYSNVCIEVELSIGPNFINTRKN